MSSISAGVRSGLERGRRECSSHHAGSSWVYRDTHLYNHRVVLPSDALILSGASPLRYLRTAFARSFSIFFIMNTSIKNVVFIIKQVVAIRLSKIVCKRNTRQTRMAVYCMLIRKYHDMCYKVLCIY